MDNNKKIKELLAKFCLDNQIQPFAITDQALQNAEIKKGDEWKRINAEEYKKLNGEDLRLKAKNNRQEIDEIILKKAQNFHLKDINNDDKNINILAKDENGNSIICSTIDFLDIYQAVYDQSKTLTEKLDSIEQAAAEIGKPVIYISNATIYDEFNQILSPENVVSGDVIDIDGPLTDRCGYEIGDFVEDAHIIDGMTDHSAGFSLTVLLSDDAIYVHIGQERELLLEKERINDDQEQSTARLVQLIRTSGEIEVQPEYGFEPGY